MRKPMQIVAVLTILLGSVAWAGEAEEKQAVKAAEEWLALVDAGHYAESWEAAATYFKNAVPRADWVKMMEGGRRPLGKLVSRTFGAKKYMTSVPGAPDGQYVVIQFKTVFENKAKAVETVTPMFDRDETWRVSGYYIR